MEDSRGEEFTGDDDAVGVVILGIPQSLPSSPYIQKYQRSPTNSLTRNQIEERMTIPKGNLVAGLSSGNLAVNLG
jgi:hypothetical protein